MAKQHKSLEKKIEELLKEEVDRWFSIGLIDSGEEDGDTYDLDTEIGKLAKKITSLAQN